MNIETVLAHHRWLREQMLIQFPELVEDEQTLADSLEGVSDLDHAIAAVVHSIDDDEAMIAGCELRAAELGERKSRHQHRIDTKRRLLASVMERAEIKKLTQPDFTLSLTAVAPKVIVIDEGALPKDYLVQPEPPPPRPDKKLIKQALVDGFDVPGAALSNGSVTVTLRRK